jgi:hypothetical protein
MKEDLTLESLGGDLLFGDRRQIQLMRPAALASPRGPPDLPGVRDAPRRSPPLGNMPRHHVAVALASGAEPRVGDSAAIVVVRATPHVAATVGADFVRRLIRIV